MNPSNETFLTETPRQALSRIEFEMGSMGYTTAMRSENESSIVMSGKYRNSFWGWFWMAWMAIFTLGIAILFLLVQMMWKVRVTIRAVAEEGGTQVYFDGNAQAVKDAQEAEVRTRPAHRIETLSGGRA